MIRNLKHFLDSPYVQMAIGLILLATSLSEAWESLDQDLRSLKLRAHHGSAIFGLFYALRAFAEILGTLADAAEAAEVLVEEEEVVEEETEKAEPSRQAGS